MILRQYLHMIGKVGYSRMGNIGCGQKSKEKNDIV